MAGGNNRTSRNNNTLDVENLDIRSHIYDASGSTGEAGYFLSTTATGTQWSSIGVSGNLAHYSWSLADCKVDIDAFGSQLDLESVTVVKTLDDVVISAVPVGLRLTSVTASWSAIASTSQVYLTYPEPYGNTTFLTACLPAITRYTPGGLPIATTSNNAVSIVAGPAIEIKCAVTPGQFAVGGGVLKVVV
jgi:hypothetical protein